jgi:hypothetical protein
LKKDYKSWTLETSFDANMKAQMEVDSGIIVSVYSLVDPKVSWFKSNFVMRRNNGQKRPPWWQHMGRITLCANCENVWAK